MRYDYRYDAEGRLKEKRASGRILTGYTYDAEGNKVSQKDLTGKILAEYVYSASGNPVVKKIGGNITSTYGYDELLNIKALKTETEKQTLADNHYFYDGNGNQIRREGLEGTTGYAYDGRNRLTEISYPSALGGYTEKLGYDAAGNRIRRETEQEITTYRYDNCNRLQELHREYKNTETSTAQPQIIRYTYDRQGNMLSEGEKKYSYDSFGRMVRAEVPVESPSTREFQVQINRYDGEGLRHEMEENGRLIKFLYNEDREVVAEETGNGTITRYIRGLGIISSDSEEAKTYYHYVSDEQGSITHVLSEDAEILNHYSYDAFGNIIEKTEKVENRFCYNGEMLDPVTQQYYLRARFYNPVIGRFTQEDTYYGDGLNLYQYCQANPVGYVDPSGHNICPTQLSLYKKYKEFFTKKMPESEAKKKAYEYMRKKMGLTADNPFTEASEGGTKSAYNDSGVRKSKNPWKSYEKSTLNSLKNTENFADSAIEHIFEGQVNARGKAVGYHYEGIEGTSGNVILGTESSINKFGVYKAKVEVNGIPKTANGGFSTFYSKDLSPQQVVDAINEAYSNCELKIGTRNTYQGITKNGMKIDMFLNQNGKIISAFPEE